MAKVLQTTEWQENPARPDEWPLGAGDYRGRVSLYKYVRYDRKSGLHVFQDSYGVNDLYAKSKHGPSGWHLRRGAYRYEFIRTVPGTLK